MLLPSRLRVIGPERLFNTSLALPSLLVLLLRLLPGLRMQSMSMDCIPLFLDKFTMAENIEAKKPLALVFGMARPRLGKKPKTSRLQACAIDWSECY